MKYLALTIQSTKENWLKEAILDFSKKINRYQKFEILEIKSVKLERVAKDQKIQSESEILINHFDPLDTVILFDQRGKTFSSEAFSRELEKIKRRGPKRVVFVVGGAFGVSDTVRERADLIVSLSSMVMNHQIALLVVLEQIYRAICIEKNLPYHNP
jgi:23S rRNA (pseudouridine1915-N3)-methyltransferase